MKSARRSKIIDLAAWNSNAAEEIGLEVFIEQLELDKDWKVWDAEELL